MNTLVKYETARHALQIAHSVDEVKEIRDKAQAMALYAKMAKDTHMCQWATEIKVRSERKAGQMLAEVGIKAGKPKSSSATTIRDSDETKLYSSNTISPKLDELGISRVQSSKWQKLGAVPEEKFEAAIVAVKKSQKEFTSTAIARMTVAPKQQAAVKRAAQLKTKPPEDADEGGDILKELEAADLRISELESLVEKLQDCDPARQIVELAKRYRQLEGRLQQEMTTCGVAKKQAEYGTGLLNKIRKALNVQKNSLIIPRIESLVVSIRSPE